jgi:hypothetical protein
VWSEEKRSETRLTFRGANGAGWEARLRRTLPAASQIAEPHSGQVLRWLPGHLGYADLDRLQPGKVDGMLNMFASAKDFVFDMLGCPAGTAWAIAPRRVRAARTTASARCTLRAAAGVGRGSASYRRKARSFSQAPATNSARRLTPSFDSASG